MASSNDKNIHARAYEIWENEGRPEGRHEHHWQQAVAELSGNSAAYEDSSTNEKNDNKESYTSEQRSGVSDKKNKNNDTSTKNMKLVKKRQY